MTFKDFLKFVRIEAKTASALPLILGICFAQYYFGEFNLLNSVLYFIAQMMFAMFVTGWNNLMDYRLAKDPIYKKRVNLISARHLNLRTVHRLLAVLAITPIFIGLYLVYRTNLFLLAAGGLGYLVGIFYTYGPFPFSRLPLGEILSGLAEGFGVFFIAVYVNVNQANLIQVTFTSWTTFAIVGNLLNLLLVFCAALPGELLVSAVMLADNTCDLDQDIKNERYTIPYYVGKDNALKIFRILAYAATIIAFLLAAFKLTPVWIMPIILVGAILVHHNVGIFLQKQDKDKTFIRAIQNLLIISGSQIIGYMIELCLSSLPKS